MTYLYFANFKFTPKCSFTPMILNFKGKLLKRGPGTRNAPMSKYFGDGSGRDSYITCNYGGVVKTGKFETLQLKKIDATEGERSRSQLDKYGMRSVTPIASNNFIKCKPRKGEIRDFRTFMKNKHRHLIHKLLQNQKVLVNRLSPPKLRNEGLYGKCSFK